MASAVPHGSPLGYERGCTSRGGCQHTKSSPYLTCVEAFAASRRDYSLRMTPPDQPILRQSPETTPAVGPARRHGTVWGFRRGCTDSRTCPQQALGRTTCREANQRYYRDYAARRRRGDGKPIAHGTRAGYQLGCRDRVECPKDDRGISCADARSSHRIDQARQQGVRPRYADNCERAHERLAGLLRAGYSVRAIAAMAGIGRTTVSAIAQRRAMTPATYAAIMAIPVIED